MVLHADRETFLKGHTEVVQEKKTQEGRWTGKGGVEAGRPGLAGFICARLMIHRRGKGLKSRHISSELAGSSGQPAF